jgi:hypothetical protein
MIQLLQPLWLAAMAAVAVPVVLHLWNDRQGKLLRIGSIALLEKRSSRRAWSRRVSEWWLLLLRCLLLIVLALLLAGPMWKRVSSTARGGWILEAGERAGVFQPLIDSLSKAGYERHVFDEGSDYWDAFRAADRVAPAGMSFYVFTSAWASRFGGIRPVTDRPVHWYTYTPADSVSKWIGAAWLSSADSVRVLEGSSRPTGTFYRYSMLAPGSPVPVKVDTTTLRIMVVADPDHRQDSRYIVAAIRAMSAFSRRRVQLSVADNSSGAASAKGLSGGSKPDWLFWLSAQPRPAGAVAGHVLQYEPGKVLPVDTWMGGEVEVRKETAQEGRGYEPVWKDGYGRPLLSLENRGQAAVYHFYSRFDPDWNELVWSRSFPVVLGELIFPGGERDVREDRRVLDPGQIAPLKSSGAVREGRAHSEGVIVDLAPACWILLVLLFVSERIVSFYAQGKK